jgi:cobalt-precorrin-5B (C1)-methyltransferase
MNFSDRNNKRLRTGITTGTCAAAAAKAAALTLLADKSVTETTVETDQGVFLSVIVSETKTRNGAVACSVIKDAGDDPDSTNGVEIIATVTKTENGVRIDGGEGVGRVTKPGLKIPVGHAAINPVPLRMIRQEVTKICEQTGYPGGLDILISVPRGEEIAKKTMNERLGIVGGISILGTTGIVEPMSEKAIIETIKTEIDMRISGNEKHLLVAPGNYGRDFARSELGLDIDKAVKCSNFIGEVLDYVHGLGLEKMTLVGHAGKLFKLAGGIMNTHSSVADCRMEIIAAHCALCGATAELIREIMDGVTVDAALKSICDLEFRRRVMESIGRKIAYHINFRTKGVPVVEFFVFTLEEKLLIHSDSNAY